MRCERIIFKRNQNLWKYRNLNAKFDFDTSFKILL